MKTVFITEHRILLPKDLEELYEVYKLEKDDKILNGEELGAVISPKVCFVFLYKM